MNEVGYKIHPHYVFKDAKMQKIPFLSIVFELRGSTVPHQPCQVVTLTRKQEKVTNGGKTRFKVTVTADSGRAGHFQIFDHELSFEDNVYFMLRFRAVKNLQIVKSRGVGDEILGLLVGGVDPLEWH
eukprot:scaffold8374_cov175-Amphora_coffeaeformis.AAC.74